MEEKELCPLIGESIQELSVFCTKNNMWGEITFVYGGHLVRIYEVSDKEKKLLGEGSSSYLPEAIKYVLKKVKGIMSTISYREEHNNGSN